MLVPSHQPRGFSGCSSSIYFIDLLGEGEGRTPRLGRPRLAQVPPEDEHNTSSLSGLPPPSSWRCLGSPPGCRGAKMDLGVGSWVAANGPCWGGPGFGSPSLA